MTLIIIVLIIALLLGGFGWRSYGATGLAPLGAIIVVLLILWLLGLLHG